MSNSLAFPSLDQFLMNKMCCEALQGWAKLVSFVWETWGARMFCLQAGTVCAAWGRIRVPGGGEQAALGMTTGT